MLLEFFSPLSPQPESSGSWERFCPNCAPFPGRQSGPGCLGAGTGIVIPLSASELASVEAHPAAQLTEAHQPGERKGKSKGASTHPKPSIAPDAMSSLGFEPRTHRLKRASCMPGRIRGSGRSHLEVVCNSSAFAGRLVKAGVNLSNVVELPGLEA